MIYFDFLNPHIIYIIYNLLFFMTLYFLLVKSNWFIKHDRTLLKLVAVLLIYTQILRYVIPLATGSFDVAEHLPFHICRISALLLLFALLFKIEKLHPILFYLAGTGIWGVLIPNGAIAEIVELTEIFFIDHFILALTPFYLLVVKKYRPEYHFTYYITFFVMFAMALFLQLNRLFDFEYFHFRDIIIARTFLPALSVELFIVLFNLAMFVFFNILYYVGTRYDARVEHAEKKHISS